MKGILARLAVVLSLGAMVNAASAQVSDPQQATAEMRHLMMKTWDRSEAPLKVEPIVIESDAAVAGWIQENRGGRALFRKRGGQWVMILCAGSALRTQSGLAASGLHAAQAEALAAKVMKAEALLSATMVKIFDSFEGSVMMEAHGAPQHDRH